MFPNRSKKTKDSQRIALPLEIDTGHWDKIFRHILFLVSGFAIALLILAAFAPVRETAIAEGKIIPVGNVVEIQHTEGGLIAKTAAKKGQFVNEGDLLLQIDPVNAAADYGETRVRRTTRAIERARLHALVYDQVPDFSPFTDGNSQIVRDQWVLYEAEHKSFLSEVSAARLRIAQEKSNVESLIVDERAAKSAVEVQEEQFEMRTQLLTQGYSSRRDYLEVKASYEQATGQLAKTRSTLSVGRQAIVESESALAQVFANRRREWSNDLARIEGEIAELDQRLLKLKQRVERLEIRAPVSGFIQMMSAGGVGEVLGPGEIAVQIVPSGNQVEAEVNIPPQHIGYIKIGAPARITLTAFDRETYGVVHGSVKSISPTTIQNERGESFYTSILTLDTQTVGGPSNLKSIQPGMVAQAEIITGAKSLMRYLLKPVYRSLNRAFSER